MSNEVQKRRTKKKVINYNYDKFGATGAFVTETATPVEYFLTSIPINQIEDLCFARDVESKTKNFDYLIQRDIDEERARKDICSYLVDNEKGKTIFLPPLIAAVVGVDNDGVIEDYYPDCQVSLNGKKLTDSNEKFEDEHEVIREWAGLFKLTTVVDEKLGTKINTDQLTSHIPVDIQQANFKMMLTKTTTGGRLVVIDGQHRLFALKYLMANEPAKVKNLTIPLCIMYSPLSTNENKTIIEELPTITNVLRKLFVDVNSTVEKVSGHFLTLLSDDNLGSIVCRDFCSKVHTEGTNNGRGLGLVEWNTKNDKESKTISRVHSITSIGVIYDTLEKLFYSKKGVDSLKILLGNSELNNSESEEIKDEYLPWTGFDNNYRNELRSIAKNEIVEHLFSLFFKPLVYKESIKIFNELIDNKLEELKEKRDASSNCIPYVANYYLYNDPIPDFDSNTETSKCKSILKEMNQWVFEQLNSRSNPTAYFSVYQKSMIHGWVELNQLCKSAGLPKSSVTDIYICLMDFALERNLNLFEYSQVYMQDNIFAGPRIKATQTTINQFKHLTIAFLGNDVVLGNLKSQLNLSQESLEHLKKIGKEYASQFFKKLITEKEKSFSKNYKHNYSLTNEQKRELNEAEHIRNNDIYSTDDSASKVEAVVDFDNLVKRMIKNDLKECARVLSIKLNYSDFFYLVNLNEAEDYA